jgi:DNA-binding transcriptional MerR regulator/methylmalonyl-CoA mutase cobalamin-binding subunit
MPNLTPLLTISAVERETGISKEVLRKWESRYGFPTPDRDEQGERIYVPEQVARLRLIKRLMDAGFRPSKVVPVTAGDLMSIAEQSHVRMAGPASTQVELELLGQLRSHDLVGLRQRLQRLLLEQGLGRFVLDTVAPLTYAVGEAWSQGKLEIYEEHLYTELIQGILRGAVETLTDLKGQPRIIFTTPPEELHSLGILMVSALFALEGAYCVPLGPQTPLEDIAGAVLAHQADVVVLSFSIAYPHRRIAPVLAELRARLPLAVAIWVGGAGTSRLGKPPLGVTVTPALETAREVLLEWRRLRVDLYR